MESSVVSEAELSAALDLHRRELVGYCYRMLGSGSEAEDAVQEMSVRAWKALANFEGRSSLRSWLYRIATNVCMDMHRSPQRRARPMELSAPITTSEADMSRVLPESAWVQPFADDRMIDAEDPAEVAHQRDSVRLAFVAALQHLPPRQRAAVILCEVLRWQASEAADLLETSVASVNSALQRARATLATTREVPLDRLDDPAHQELLERYVDAFERYDMDALVALLKEDVDLSMPPFEFWLRGSDELISWFMGPGIECKDGRLIPIELNGTAGFGSYHKTGPGLWEPFAIQVVEVADGRISGHHNFLYPELFELLGLPERIEA